MSCLGVFFVCSFVLTGAGGGREKLIVFYKPFHQSVDIMPSTFLCFTQSFEKSAIITIH